MQILQGVHPNAPLTVAHHQMPIVLHFNDGPLKLALPVSIGMKPMFSLEGLMIEGRDVAIGTFFDHLVVFDERR